MSTGSTRFESLELDTTESREGDSDGKEWSDDDEWEGEHGGGEEGNEGEGEGEEEEGEGFENEESDTENVENNDAGAGAGVGVGAGAAEEDEDEDEDEDNFYSDGTRQEPHTTFTSRHGYDDYQNEGIHTERSNGNPLRGRKRPFQTDERERAMRAVFGDCRPDTPDERGQEVFGNAPDDDDSDEAFDQDEEDNDTIAANNIFPSCGVSCVGCQLAASVTKIDAFIEENLLRVQDKALWKLAAEVYKRQIVAPVVAEGQRAPDWPAESIRLHYTEHACNNRLARKGTVQKLQAARKLMESAMVRVNCDEDGKEERDVDPAKLTLYLKVVAMESQQRVLLHGINSTKL
jgi:hypothetical protein